MASLAQLQNDVASWLNRQDILTSGVFPGWVLAVETQLSETLRARCQVKSAYQNIDADYIPLPADFATMESIRDTTSGEELDLKDQWSGHWTDAYPPNPWSVYGQQINGPATAYRLVGNCIEFLPHTTFPNPPDPSWVPQQVLMGWYAKPQPLLLPTDTNSILENLYSVYLYGLCKIGAMFELDEARSAQMDAQFQQVVTQANLWKQQSDYSGAPLRAELATVF